MAASVGEQLKQARIERGLTLDQVTEAIHLRKAYLEALENNQRSELPSAVQGRGYLRLYAGFLNLPVGSLLDVWDGKLPAESAPKAAEDDLVLTEPAAQPEAVEPPPPPPTPGGPADFRPPQPGEAQNSQAIFIEIGQKLQQQREALGLSRAEVERYTRLRQHYLQALEEGRMDKLPSPVQGRGMLSNYTAFLNLNEDQILLRYAEGLQQRRLERIPPPVAQPVPAKKRPVRQASPLRQFLTPDVLFGVIVVGAILFFAVRTAASINDLRAQEGLPTAPAIAEVLLMNATGSPSVEETALQSGAAALTLPPPAATPPFETATQPAASNGESPLSTDPAAQPLQPTAAQVTVAPINDDPLQVYIIARQRAWLKIVVDNKELFNGRVVPGNAYAYSGARRIELLTGNAAALQVFYNQQDLGTLGLAGEVTMLVFVSEGMQTPTATLTFTPTPTPLVTNTPTPSATPQATLTITPFVPLTKTP